MKKVLGCRRSIVALISIAACTLLGLHLGMDTSGSIAIISVGIAGSNAAQSVMSQKVSTDDK